MPYTKQVSLWRKNYEEGSFSMWKPITWCTLFYEVGPWSVVFGRVIINGKTHLFLPIQVPYIAPQAGEFHPLPSIHGGSCIISRWDAMEKVVHAPPCHSPPCACLFGARTRGHPGSECGAPPVTARCGLYPSLTRPHMLFLHHHQPSYY